MELGIYNAVPVKGVLTKSSTGNPQMAVTMRVTHIERNGDWDELPEAKERTLYVSLTDASMPHARKKLAMLGFNGNFTTPGFGPDMIALKHWEDVYNGKKTNKWDLAEFDGAIDHAPADDDTVRRMNSLWQATTPQRPAGAMASPPR